MQGRTIARITAGIPYPPYAFSVEPVEALTAPDQGEADATPAAEAVYWLRLGRFTHPDTPGRTSSLSDLITQWEMEPEWTADQEPDECPE